MTVISKQGKYNRYSNNWILKVQVGINMYRPLPDGLTIKESKLQGLGLFATKEFDPDVVLGIVHIKNKNFPHGYIRTALGAFYNHDDNPNCKNSSGFWHQLPVKYLVTTRPIKAGEELTANYTLYNDFNRDES